MEKQISFDNLTKEKLKIDKPIRLIELFAGIGSQAQALKNIGADFEHWVVCDFDKYAMKSYNAIHGTDFPTSDITQIKGVDLNIVDTDKYCYILTYSFPCTSLSIAGKQQGMEKGSGTASSLLWEVERLLLETENLPQVLLMENVTDVHNEKNIKGFQEWGLTLERLGYSNYISDLNAKDYGIPQNRDRCFMVSVLSNYYYEFPQAIPLKKRLKDMLENEVDKKYYLSNAMLKYFEHNTIKQSENGNGFKFTLTDIESITKAITTKEGSRMDDNFINVIGMLESPPYDKMLDMDKRVYNTETISPTVTTVQGGNKEIKIMTLNTKDKDGKEIRKDYEKGTVKEQRKNMQQLEEREDDITNTITTVQKDNLLIEPKTVDLVGGAEQRIRKLTPKECWRLMGQNDTDFEKAQNAGISNSQLYKQAGNSIVVQVLEAIFREMI
jgi:DNA-methyltransferase (dcm)